LVGVLAKSLFNIIMNSLRASLQNMLKMNEVGQLWRDVYAVGECDTLKVPDIVGAYGAGKAVQ